MCIHLNLCTGLQAAEGFHHSPGSHGVHMQRLLEDGPWQAVWGYCHALQAQWRWKGGWTGFHLMTGFFNVQLQMVMRWPLRSAWSILERAYTLQAWKCWTLYFWRIHYYISLLKISIIATTYSGCYFFISIIIVYLSNSIYRRCATSIGPAVATSSMGNTVLTYWERRSWRDVFSGHSTSLTPK